MKCPKCRRVFRCGCNACAPVHAKKGLVCSKPDRDLDTCGHCGLTMHVDQWLEREVKQYDKIKARKKA